jgi:hypothetical protein
MQTSAALSMWSWEYACMGMYTNHHFSEQHNSKMENEVENVDEGVEEEKVRF